MPKYITIQGDMWDGIAKKVYGDERHMNALLKANPDHIDTVIFSGDIVLECPHIPVAKVKPLAPWKR